MKVRSFKDLEKDILKEMEKPLVSEGCFSDDSFEIWLNKQHGKILETKNVDK